MGRFTLRQRRLPVAGIALLAAALAAGGFGALSAQEAAVQEVTLRSYPVAIHAGDCTDPTTEPRLDLGFVVPLPIFGADEEVDGVVVEPADEGTPVQDDQADVSFAEDDALFEEETEFFAGEFYQGEADDLIDPTTPVLVADVDGDGFLDQGLDRDGDGVLGTAEVVSHPLVWGFQRDLDDVVADAGDDAELDDLRDNPHVIVIHRGDVAATDYLACGGIAGVVGPDGELHVPLRSLTADGFVGLANLERGDGGEVAIAAWLNLPPLTAAAQPTTTPTLEPTIAPATETPTVPPTETAQPPTETPAPPTETPTPEPTPTEEPATPVAVGGAD